MRPPLRPLRLTILAASLLLAAAVTAQAQIAETSFPAADAGTVTYRVVDGQLELLAATPASGWTVKVERAAGHELDLDFLRATARVQVDVEFEDGGVRERVRVRDDHDQDPGDDRDDRGDGRGDDDVDVPPRTSTPAPSDDGTTGSSAPAPAAAEVVIPDDLFSPAAVTIRAGGTVTWRNQDGSHTVTAADDAFDSGVFDDGESFSRTFTQSGTVSYLCRLHSGMTGTVTVVDAGAAPAESPTSEGASSTPAPRGPSPSPSETAYADAEPDESGSSGAPVAAPAASASESSSGLPFAATVLFLGMIAAFVTGRVVSRS